MIVKNINGIAGSGLMGNCWLSVDDSTGRFTAMGMSKVPQAKPGEEVVDARGGAVLPAYCDSHTHIVYAGSRWQEFLFKIEGLTYEQIAQRGGGILNSADLLHKTSEQSLYEQSLERAREVMAKGTGAIEIKSGYGLTLPDELKMLRVVARIAEAVPMRVRATFLGAHAVGRAYQGRQDDYVEHIVNDMLPAVAAEGLADFVDVFCDFGFFTPAQTARILEAAARYGLRPKIHANELGVSGGVEVGVEHGAVSVDHLERAGDEQLSLLAASDTIATMLPGASFFLNMPYAPAARAIELGCRVALASDYNPGSSPNGDMRFVWALACITMRLLPHVALQCLTLNGAAAMDLADDYGSVTAGKVANFIVTRPGIELPEVPYQYTTPYIADVYMAGKKV